MNILYLCTGNSCRSQMAEAWTRFLRPEIHALSAGTAPGEMDPYAVAVMEEEEVYLIGQYPKSVDELPPDVEFDYVVTLCSGAAENCPVVPGPGKRVHRGFDDPPALVKGMTEKDEILAVYRRVRDEIRAMAHGLPGSLG
ncbi:arsenate reductase ArsC [Pseudodesulfovibrio sp.]|uniref:arsenate reductase ArsC n=1 Tax=unclassified Pseudodesulfovibrio TaxID=2661612 RepID=UPI003B00D833